MTVINDNILGAIKIASLPDRNCFTSWEEFIQQLPNILMVEVPRSVSGVVFSTTPPDNDSLGKIWYRIDTGGNFLGLYTFQAGQWQLAYAFAPNQIIWTWGDSNVIPPGFTLITTGDDEIPSTVVTFIMAQYVMLSPGQYQYFAVRYTGF